MNYRKKIKRKKVVTGKILIDSFFKKCREKHYIYAFQNESKLKYDFLKKIDFKCLVTLTPKREVFVEGSDNKLIDRGLTLYYSNFDEATFLEIKEELFSLLGNTYYIKNLKEDTRNKTTNETVFNGQFVLLNLREKR